MDNGSTMNCNGQPSTFSWHRLPRELQLDILSFVARRQGSTNHVKSSSEKSIAKQHVGQLAKCAAVCRDWQEYFENILFRNVTVHQRDLARLHKISLCRTERIQHLWLRIELLPYDCPRCQEFGDINHEKDRIIFEKAIRNLFRVLHRWKGRNPSHLSGGLTLEISVHSPSDSKHEFQNISFDDDNNDEGTDVCTIDDPKHDWVSGRRTHQPFDMAVLDLFELWEYAYMHPEKVEWSAPVVKHLLIRRQTRRHFPQPTLLRLFKGLPRLESLNMEFWRMYSGEDQSLRDDDIIGLLKSHLPRSVQRVTLFEDFDEDFDSIFARDSFNQLEFIRPPSLALGATLAGLRNQKSLHVSFIVDAYDFFDGLRHYRHDRAWRNLTNLSMTSILLRPETHLSQIQSLLMMAASATRRFPNLEVLELWYGRRGEACLFRFSRTRDGVSKIFRAGTWELPLPPAAMKAWNGISELRGGRGLMVSDTERIDPELLRSHGDAIHHLGLVSDVVHPVSLRQIRREAQSYGPS